MSNTNNDVTTGPVLLMPGVRHYQTSGFAETWEAYDAFSEQDGWREIEAREGGTIWKEGVINGRRVTVFAPGPRPHLSPEFSVKVQPDGGV